MELIVSRGKAGNSVFIAQFDHLTTCSSYLKHTIQHIPTISTIPANNTWQRYTNINAAAPMNGYITESSPNVSPPKPGRVTCTCAFQWNLGSSNVSFVWGMKLLERGGGSWYDNVLTSATIRKRWHFFADFHAFSHYRAHLTHNSSDFHYCVPMFFFFGILNPWDCLPCYSYT